MRHMNPGKPYRECPKTFHIPYTPGTSQFDSALERLLADHPEIYGEEAGNPFVDMMLLKGRPGVYVLKKPRGKSS